MEGYIKATPRLKWGYELAPDAEGMARPIPEDMAVLNEVVEGILGKKLSLQEGIDIIKARVGKPLSREGLRKIVAERDTSVPQLKDNKKDWEINPDNYERNEDGSFVLRTNGIPVRKKRPKSGHNFHSAVKAKQAVRRSVANKKKEVERLQTRLENQKAALNKKKEVAQRLDAADGVANKQPAVITEEQLVSLPPTAQAAINNGDTPVAFRPHPGPQTDFLASSEKDVLYGGAAGGKDKSFYRLLST